MAAKIARFLGKAWLYLGGALVLIGYAGTVYFHGFGALWGMLIPYSGKGIINMIAVVITLAPGFILIQLAEGLERQERKRIVGALLLAPMAAALSVGLLWLSILRPFVAADERRTSATCTDYGDLDQNQKISLAYGYLEGVQAALDKEPVDILVPPSDPKHPLWWVLPRGLDQKLFAGLAKTLEVHCQSAQNRQKPILDAFLSVAYQKEGWPSLGISFDKQKTDPWKKFLGDSVSCSAYSASPQGTRQAIVHGYFVGTEAVRVSLKTSADNWNSLFIWPSTMNPQTMRVQVDKGCLESNGATVREVLWVTAVELGVKGKAAGPQGKGK